MDPRQRLSELWGDESRWNEVPMRIDPAARRRRRGRATRWSVSAAVAVVAIGALFAFAGGGYLFRSPADLGGGTAATSGGYSADVIHDGDTVEATGQVVAAPGKPIEFCPFLPEPAVAYATPHPPSCGSFGVAVTGVDLGRLGAHQTVAGVLSGAATLRGVYREGAIAVTRARALKEVAYSAPGPTDTLTGPCVTSSAQTSAQLKAARAALITRMGRFKAWSVGAEGGGSGERQRYVIASLEQVTPAVLAFLAQYPPGLVRLEPWLVPLDPP